MRSIRIQRATGSQWTCDENGCTRVAVVTVDGLGYCRGCARQLAVELITKAGTPADNRALVAQEK